MKFRTVLFWIALLFPLSARAQYPHWTRCDTGYHGPNGGRFNGRFSGEPLSPYFVNPQIGFAYEYDIGGSTHPRLYRTLDSAQTWQLCDTATIFGNIFYMCFSTPGHGYLATAGPGEICETFDTGNSWVRIQPPVANDDYKQVWLAGKTLFAADESGAYMTTNDGRSWSGTPASIDYITGDGNNYVVLYWFGSDSGSQGGHIFTTSTDDGLTWTTNPFIAIGDPEDHSYGPICFQGTYTLLYLYGSGGTLVRQLNLQSPWDSVTGWDSINVGFNSGVSLDQASGCSVYGIGVNQNTLELIRTTDLGSTWKIVSSPPFTSFNLNAGGAVRLFLEGAFSVVGNGAVVYLIDDSGFMWRTTDGGDGTMSETAPLYTISLVSQLPVTSIGDTLETTACDSANFSFTFQYTGACSSATLDSAFLSGLDTSEYRLSRTSHTAGENVPDTAWIAIHPAQPGIRMFTVHAQYINQEKNIQDTSFSLALNVAPNPGVLDLTAPALYDFGTQALCAPVTVRDTFGIAAHGCEAVTVDSVVFHADSSQFTDFTFTNIKKSFTADSISRKFPISFLPRVADTERGSIFIYWSDGETQHVDTIPAQGVGVSDTRTFAIASDTLVTRMCDSTTGTITITNTTCGTLGVDSLTLPAGIALALGMNPAFPLSLAPGGSDSVVVHLALGEPGTSVFSVGDTTLEAVAHVQFTEHGDTTSFDTTLAITIRVSRGTPAATLSTASLDFGTVSTCGQSVTLPVVLSSTGCDTLTCSGAVPAPPFIIVNGSAVSLPVGASDTILVTFMPTQSGIFNDTLVFSTSAGTETVPLQGMGIADRVALALPVTTLALPQVIAGCGADTAIVSFTNAGCKSIVIDSVVGLSAPFTLGSISNLSLATTDTAHFEIFYTPSLAGLNAGAARIYYLGADSTEHDTTIAITAAAIEPTRVSVYLNPASLSDTNQGLVSIPVYASSTASVTGIGSIAFRLDLRTDLLTPESISSPIAGAGTATLQTDANGASITLTLPGNFSISSDTLIATLICRAYVTDTTETAISLTSASSTGVANCLSLTSVGTQSFTLVPTCGDPTLTETLAHGSVPFTILSIVPNPAQNVVQISGTGFGTSGMEIELFDMLGRAQGVKSTLSSNEMMLDASSVPAGTYYLRLSALGYVQTRKLNIER